ncbi:MAG TPA: VOC family protein [Acidimicrobiia bacterium]
MPDRVVFNHVGQCVSDLDRSRRFYVELLGFELWREISPPDAATAKLLGLAEPLALTACYLQRDGLVLELLHFGARAATSPATPRSMDELGLTHISVSCDIADICGRIADYGGQVLVGTHIGNAVFVRDPDGQLVELLPLAYADAFAPPAG